MFSNSGWLVMLHWFGSSAQLRLKADDMLLEGRRHLGGKRSFSKVVQVGLLDYHAVFREAGSFTF